MTMKEIARPRWVAALLAAVIPLTAGCSKKSVDHTARFTEAINTYYGTHPVCLWKQSVRFPVVAEGSDAAKAPEYDALVDQGLLVRTAEKTAALAGTAAVPPPGIAAPAPSTPAVSYDLSQRGRAVFVPDTEQPGSGNFCYGRRTVSSIDSLTPASDERGSTSQVIYHYTITDAPAWATAEGTKNAYPELRALLNGTHAGQAILIETNEGWKVARTGPLTAGS
jgi:hypothetical protein